MHSGERGVAADGAMPTGLMGETFDADDEAKDGAKGKGAQGEGALRGNKRDYEVHDRVDADFYLATYRDVGEGAKGQPKPRKFARKHFERHGRREGRTPWWRGGSGEFDEIFYLEAHADVAEAVKKGDFRNGAHHFWMHGRAEGRPSQRA